MAKLSSAALGAVLLLVARVTAMPAPTPVPTAKAALTANVSPAVTAAPLALSLGPFTLGGGFIGSHTVINNVTYPILGANLQGGYDFTQTDLSATGLLGLGISNRYTTIGDLVFPILDFTLAEADSELFTIPGLLTFKDGGVSSGTLQHTDILCSLELPLGAGCQGLSGLVTGAILGIPFTLKDDFNPTLDIPIFPSQSLVATAPADASIAIGTFLQGGAGTPQNTIGGNLGPYSLSGKLGPPLTIGVGGPGLPTGGVGL